MPGAWQQVKSEIVEVRQMQPPARQEGRSYRYSTRATATAAEPQLQIQLQLQQ
jgi:hypothetical protein